MAGNIAAAAAAAQEVDPVLKKAIKLLHSTNPTSGSDLRLLLDEALKLRFGPDKIMSKNMSQRMLDDEANFPGRATPQPPAQAMATEMATEIINLTNSPDKAPSESPDTIADSDDGSAAGIAMSGVVNTGDTGDFGDLNCCVCGEMVYKATNRLIECSDCGALYHQECHKPPITNEEAADDQVHTWQCDACCNKPSTSRSTSVAIATAPPAPTVVITDEPIQLATKSKSSVPSSRSSTSSNSSSPFYKPEISSSANVSSSKHGHKSSSSSSAKSHKEERSSRTAAPALTAIAAPEKHTSSSTSSSRRSSSTKSSKSKHHESSSKRRAK